MKRLILILCLLCAPVLAQDFNNVKYLHNYDGDTITFDLGETVPPLWRNSRVRLQGIDTPEIKSGKPLAFTVRDFVHTNLSNSKIIDLKNCSLDKWGRPLCAIKYDGKDLTQELLNRGYGYAYFGGTKIK